MEGTPYNDEVFSDAPPRVIKTIICRLSFDQTMKSRLKAQLKLCERRIKYIVQSCWHDGYNACSSLKKSQLELELLTQTSYFEARYCYTCDQAHLDWFLAGWLSACRTIN